MTILTRLNLMRMFQVVVIVGLIFFSTSAFSQSDCDASANLCCELNGQAALAACERAIVCMSHEGLFPSDCSKVYMCQGVALGELNRTEESLQAFRKALEYEPDSAKTYYNMGITLEDLGKDRKARRAYRKAVKLNPQMTLAWGNLGVAAFNIGHYRESVKAFDTATELDPSYFDSRPEQRDLWEKAVNVRPWSVAWGHEISIRFTPSIGYLFKVDDALKPYLKKFLYIMPDTEVDIQLYKRIFATASFMYMRTTGSGIDLDLNLYGISFGAKYVSKDEIKPQGDDFLDKSRFWIGAAVGPYITNLEASIIGVDLSATSTNFGFNFGTGFDYYIYPNLGLGLQLKMHYVRFNGNISGTAGGNSASVNYGDDYMLISGGPSIMWRF